MLPALLAAVIASAPLPAPVARVAVYDGPGVSPSRAAVVAALKSANRFALSTVSPAQIQAGDLAHFDLVVHPGGIAGTQGKALGGVGRKAEQDFVRAGGGFLGVCAGAYLATCDYDWSLRVLNAVVVDKEHWNRGTGNVAVTTTVAGRAVLGTEARKLTLYYHQGPLLSAAARRDLPDYEEFAAFSGDIHGNGAEKGVMPGTTAACGGTFGKGRVFAFSPHPERTKETEGLLCAAAAWAARKADPPSVGVAAPTDRR